MPGQKLRLVQKSAPGLGDDQPIFGVWPGTKSHCILN